MARQRKQQEFSILPRAKALPNFTSNLNFRSMLTIPPLTMTLFELYGANQPHILGLLLNNKFILA